MPTIKITDQLGVELLNAPAGPISGLARYLKGNTAAFASSGELALAFLKPIATLGKAPQGLALKFASDGAFGTSGVEWTLAAGARVTVEAAQAGDKLPGDEVFGNSVVVEQGRTLIAATFMPTLAVGGTGGVGDLKFGFDAGGSVAFRSGRHFDLAGGPGPKLGDALKALLTTGIVPGHVLDLASMEEGDIGSVSGDGKLKFSASFDVAQVLNPMATLPLPVGDFGKIGLKAGASLQVGASVAISGAYQIRVSKLTGGRVRLGFYKMSSRQFQFDVTASAGLDSVTAGKFDVLEKLMGFLGSSAPKEDAQGLQAAGISDAQIKTLQETIEASLSRSLAISLAGSFGLSSTSSLIFEYEFEMSQLGHEGMDALNLALQGDLSPLTVQSSNELPQGVKMLSTVLDTVKKRTTTWKLNLLGIVNVLSVSKLIVHGHMLFNAESGELVIADSATAEKLRVKTRPHEAEAKKLQKVLMQSLVITAAYRASGTGKLANTLQGSMTYFEQDVNANRQTVKDYLDNFVALGLMKAAAQAPFLDQIGKSRASLYLDASFSNDDFDTMFFDAGGKPRPESDYHRIGREAVASLIQPGDPNDYRRQPMLVGDAASDQLWKAMLDAGPAGFTSVLPPSLKGDVPSAVVRGDLIIIAWWAMSMNRAAVAAAEMRKFIDTNAKTAEQLQKDQEFQKLRGKLSDALKHVVSDALPDFGDAWGLVVMDAASGRKGAINGLIVTSGPVLAQLR